MAFNLFKKTAVKVSEVYRGSHGDHWRALLGFKLVDAAPEMLTEKIVEVLDTSAPKKLGDNRAKHVKDMGKIQWVVIAENNLIASGYPVLKTGITLPFISKEVLEWHHSDNIEAQIAGGGRNEFGLTFFAIDYLENKKIYKTIRELNVNLSGFAYVLKESKNIRPEFSNNFVGYMPNSQTEMKDVYDFRGQVLEFEEYNQDGINGYIIKTKLINREGLNDYFNLDIFVNKENTDLEKLEIGMRITGCFWLQGKIA